MSMIEKIKILLKGIPGLPHERFSFTFREIVAVMADREAQDPNDPFFINVVRQYLYAMQRDGEVVKFSDNSWSLREYSEVEIVKKKYRSIDDEWSV